MANKILKIWEEEEEYEEEEEQEGPGEDAPAVASEAEAAPAAPAGERTGEGERVAEVAAKEGAAATAADAARLDIDLASDTEKNGLASQFAKIEGQIPNNEWGMAYHMVKDEIADNPEFKNSPGTKALMALLALAAKFSGYADMIPGHMLKNIKDSETLAEEHFSAEELAKIASANPGATAGRVSNLPQKNSEEYAKLDIEAASTKYAAYALWGVAEIESATVLAARLYHSKNQADKPYYEVVEYGKVTAHGLPYGSILIMTYDVKTAEKVVGFATGGNGGKEIVYYHPKEGKKTFNIGDKNSPLKSAFSLQLAFKPSGAEVTGARPATPENAKAAVDEAGKKIDALLAKQPQGIDDNTWRNGKNSLAEIQKIQRQISRLSGKKDIDKATADALKPTVEGYQALLKKVEDYFRAFKVTLDAELKMPGAINIQVREKESQLTVDALQKSLQQKFDRLKKYSDEAEAFLSTLNKIN